MNGVCGRGFRAASVGSVALRGVFPIELEGNGVLGVALGPLRGLNVRGMIQL